jgi:hypothetical protein
MLIDLSARVSARQLRWFAGLWLPAMCVMVGFALRRRGFDLAAVTIWTAGAVLAPVGLVRPMVIRPVYTGLIWLTFPIGWVVSHVVLLAMYFVVLTPLGALVRLFYDPMERAFDREATSYWETRDSTSPTRYFRQF